MNNKMTGIRIAAVLISVFLLGNLSGCGSKPVAQPKPVQPAPAPEPAPPAPEPMSSMEAEPEAVASSGVIRPDYPERYVVVKGDTLWDISKRFLNDPWLWPSVWHINPEIRNPHLIYPGDVIVMYVIDGKPYITVDGEGGMRPDSTAAKGQIRAPKEPPGPQLRVEKRSPSARVSGIRKAIATIPANLIAPFLDRPRVVSEDELEDAPYIVSSYGENMISGTGHTIYALNFNSPQIRNYNIVRPGDPYVDPKTNDVLGYEAIYLGDALLLRNGKDEDDPATFTITKSVREVLNGDVLVPDEQREQMFHYTPRPPENKVSGQIMSVFNGVTEIGQYSIVVLNLGERDGMAPGHVLAAYEKGQKVQDKEQFFLWNSVQLPDERAGLLMVFRTYKKVSYALVMESLRALHINDRVENP